MPEMWRIRLQWKDNSPSPETQELAFVSSAEDALGEMNAAINNDVVPTLGESLTISATRMGALRGTPG
jgi:hypothetical protein